MEQRSNFWNSVNHDALASEEEAERVDEKRETNPIAAFSGKRE